MPAAKKTKDTKDMRRIKTALFLDPDQVVALKNLQQDFPGINMSEHVRRSISLYLLEMAKVAKRMPKLPGAPQEK